MGWPTVSDTNSEWHECDKKWFLTTCWDEIRKNFWPETRQSRAMTRQSVKNATIIVAINSFKIRIQRWSWYHWIQRNGTRRMIYRSTFFVIKKLFLPQNFFCHKKFFLPQKYIFWCMYYFTFHSKKFKFYVFFSLLILEIHIEHDFWIIWTQSATN